ncbi:GDSL-type esterase/lipase family protein [Carnobacterium jeotgali]|uniref:GDSL-type esterase/lipase family protein n=1 Tax=Carnobacterium jeotgali TaxID=545534 RepID=UPI00388E88BC
MAEVFDFGLQQHKIKMDGKFFENNLFAVAGDTGRRLEVQLLNSDNMVQNTTGISLRLNADVAGQATYAEATLVDATKGLYELDLPNGMLMAPGNWQFQWQIIGNTGEKLHSFAFMGSVGSNLSEGGTEATNFYLNAEDLKQMQEDFISGAFNSTVLETNIAGKLRELETEYAPNLTEVTVQLAQTELKKLNRNENESITKAMLSQEIKEDLNNGTIEFILNTSEIEDGAVSPQKIATEGFSVNVFDKETAVLGSYYSGSVGAQISLVTSSNWYGNHSPIPTKQGDIIRFNLAYMNGYYRGVDSTGKVVQITPTAPNPAGIAQVVVAANVVGFYTAVYKTDINNFMITINNPMPSTYTSSKLRKTLEWLDYKPKSIEIEALSDELLNTISDSNVEWFGKSFISNGTSISWQDGKVYAGTSNVARGYQTIIKEKLGFSSYVNAGASGKAMADGTTNGSGIVTTGLTQSYTPHSLATIEAGTNDFKLNVPMGELKEPGFSTLDRTTFMGAYQTLIEYILNQKPNIRIVLFTPLQRDSGGYNGWSFINPAGHSLDDYREAILKLGKLYGLPVCDLYVNSGFNKFTLSIFTMDGLHPNDVGYLRMGNFAAEYIKGIGL